jgi:Ca2+-binding RTX toxin-like protein
MFDLNLDAVNATRITVSGDAGITFANSSYTALTTLDASGVTAIGAAGVVTFVANNIASTITGGAGNDSLTGGAQDDVISGGAGTDALIGGAGNDNISGGADVDTITGGTGADTLTGGAGAGVFEFGTDGSVSGTSLDVIADFNVGGADQLGFGAAAVLLAAEANGTTATTDVDTTAGGLISFAAADDTLAEKIAAIQADTQLDAINSVGFFVDGANTYVYYAGAAVGNADDQIIQLSGITSLTTMTVLVGGDVTIA